MAQRCERSPPINVAWVRVLPGAMGHIAAPVRSHKNGLISFKGTIKQTTETMVLPLKQ